MIFTKNYYIPVKHRKVSSPKNKRSGGWSPRISIMPILKSNEQSKMFDESGRNFKAKRNVKLRPIALPNKQDRILQSPHDKWRSIIESFRFVAHRMQRQQQQRQQPTLLISQRISSFLSIITQRFSYQRIWSMDTVTTLMNRWEMKIPTDESNMLRSVLHHPIEIWIILLWGFFRMKVLPVFLVKLN